MPCHMEIAWRVVHQGLPESWLGNTAFNTNSLSKNRPHLQTDEVPDSNSILPGFNDSIMNNIVNDRTIVTDNP